MAGDGNFQTVQKVATALYRLDEVAENVREARVALTARMEQVEVRVHDIRERVAGLEAARRADRAELKGELAQHRTEGEAELTNLRERVARLEAARDADRSRFEADLSRFKLEVERAEMRLSRRLPGSKPPAGAGNE